MTPFPEPRPRTLGLQCTSPASGAWCASPVCDAVAPGRHGGGVVGLASVGTWPSPAVAVWGQDCQPTLEMGVGAQEAECLASGAEWAGPCGSLGLSAGVRMRRRIPGSGRRQGPVLTQPCDLRKVSLWSRTCSPSGVSCLQLRAHQAWLRQQPQVRGALPECLRQSVRRCSQTQLLGGGAAFRPVCCTPGQTGSAETQLRAPRASPWGWGSLPAACFWSPPSPPAQRNSSSLTL